MGNKMKKLKLAAVLGCLILILQTLRSKKGILVELGEVLAPFLPGLLAKNKMILLYTTWNLNLYWKDLDAKKLANYFDQCTVKSCMITYDRELISQASAVLFHGQDMGSDDAYSPENLAKLMRHTKQRWIWVNQESPANIKVDEKYNGIFNWTATYHRDSDIFLPYFFYQRLQKKNEISGRNLKFQKTKFAAWIVSDCGGLRNEYVLELQKYINITVYGGCKENYKLKGGDCIRNTKECWKELKQYKFYLAFENSICKDYVTEKYWENALMNEMVPLVMGANYDEVIAVPGSYIDVSNFKSIRALASFLMYLDRNEDEYLKYFNWKKKYEIYPGRNLFCAVCERLHNRRLPTKTHHHLDAFWSKEKFCSSNNEIVNALKWQIKVSKRS